VEILGLLLGDWQVSAIVAQSGAYFDVTVPTHEPLGHGRQQRPADLVEDQPWRIRRLTPG
jgi:hypothetical protein